MITGMEVWGREGRVSLSLFPYDYGGCDYVGRDREDDVLFRHLIVMFLVTLVSQLDMVSRCACPCHLDSQIGMHFLSFHLFHVRNDEHDMYTFMKLSLNP